MTGWPVVGHEWAIDLLQRAIVNGRLSHAYLLTGPTQVGKTTLARAFARSLLCERGMQDLCDVETSGADSACRTCRRIMQGHFPDVQLVTAERQSIQIDQIRTLQSDAALSPLEGRYKVFIIREIERTTPPAANALLKTLEEPPPHVVLLLTSARRDLVLPTILSRCQVLSLRPLSQHQIETALASRWGVEAERAALLARLSGGRLGWAVNAHTDPKLWEHRAKHLDDLLVLAKGDYLARLSYAESLSRHSDIVEDVLGLWATWWRDILLVQRGAPGSVINLDRIAQLQEQAGVYRPDQVESAITDLMTTLRRLRANVNARLALDVLALRLPTTAGT